MVRRSEYKLISTAQLWYRCAHRRRRVRPTWSGVVYIRCSRRWWIKLSMSDWASWLQSNCLLYLRVCGDGVAWNRSSDRQTELLTFDLW